MALVLLVAGTLVCSVRLLHPQRLTPVVTRLANQNLNADVSIGSVELSLRKSFPFLTVDVDRLTIESRDTKKLSDDDRMMLPDYADTLLDLKHLTGSLNISKLALGEIALGDVILTRPTINAVVFSDEVSNFDIFPPEEEEEKEPFDLTKLSIHRFAIVDPGPIRYYDAVEGTEMALNLQSAAIDGTEPPKYSLDIKGTVPLPMLEGFVFDRLPFDINGDIIWDATQPEALGLENFKFNAAMLSGRFTTHMNFGETLVINDLDLQLDPIPAGKLLSQLPAETLESLELPADFATDIAPQLSLTLDQPFDTGSESLPHATVKLLIDPCSLTYNKARFDRLSADITATLKGDDRSQATIAVNSLTISGPATDLRITGRVTDLQGDPLISGEINGSTDIQKLPPVIANLLNGYAAGTVTAQLNFTGRPSMFAPGSYYKLSVKGDITGRDLYYLSNDTANMVYISRVNILFGNTETYSTHQGTQIKLLGASIDVDSVNVLHTQYSFTGKNLHLGLATKNQKYNTDTTAITPLGGGLRLDAFDFKLLSDTITVRARQINGSVAMRGTEGDLHRPRFDFNLDINRLSTGTPGTRFMLNDANVHFAANKLPARKPSPQLQHTADSIAHVHPELPPDSVYALAMEKYRHRHRTGPPRVHPQYMADTGDEVIDWGTSKDLSRLLLTWRLDGSVRSDRVGLYTPYFPMRNRIRNFNVTFNNDTIRLDNVAYKVGHSDFLLSGLITNLRRGLTSRTHTQSLKANFDIVSDTIDVNQLAELVFRGAAYADNDRRSFSFGDTDDTSDDDLDAAIDRYVADTPDTLAPLLIPRNIEASLKMRANNVLYSDLMLHRLGGEVLVYNGALNLHRLKASSDIGAVELSALYDAPNINNLNFGFGLDVKRFDIQGFLRMVPAIDSVMPLMRDFSGIINSNIAATVKLNHRMDFDMQSLQAAINIEGDSLVLIDEETYRTIGKWLRFKDKKHNIIDHMSVEMVVDSSVMHIYPFVFDLDRYRLGVQGYNDLDMNFNYHIAVLKSPLPFKFGINLSGNPDKYKVRFGGAKFNERQAVERVPIADTTRVNLIRQIENVFRRGVDDSRFARLNIDRRPMAAEIDLNTDTLTHADSLRLIEEGLIPAPAIPATAAPADKKSQKSKKNKKESAYNTDYDYGFIASLHQLYATLPSRRTTQGRPARHGRHTV